MVIFNMVLLPIFDPPTYDPWENVLTAVGLAAPVLGVLGRGLAVKGQQINMARSPIWQRIIRDSVLPLRRHDCRIDTHRHLGFELTDMVTA
jgi:hypothetical protein